MRESRRGHLAHEEVPGQVELDLPLQLVGGREGARDVADSLLGVAVGVEEEEVLVESNDFRSAAYLGQTAWEVRIKGRTSPAYFTPPDTPGGGDGCVGWVGEWRSE